MVFKYLKGEPDFSMVNRKKQAAFNIRFRLEGLSLWSGEDRNHPDKVSLHAVFENRLKKFRSLTAEKSTKGLNHSLFECYGII
jgi:hypothetical protein